METVLLQDMNSTILINETDYGSKPLRDHLKREFYMVIYCFLFADELIPLLEGGLKANQIFLPILESASKARKLRTTLSILERSRFFFNLPSFIMESIDAVRYSFIDLPFSFSHLGRQGRYDLAIRDYKKGKYILENRPSQLLPLGAMTDDASFFSAQQRQKRILNKVWAIVEKAMADMKGSLVSQLEDPNRSVEEHGKTLE